MSDAQNTGNAASETRPTRLRDALRQARIEAADRTGVVVELRDAEVARLEILNEALDPLFAQVPEKIDLFDRGVSEGETPRLWIDAIAHVGMGRDKRVYRFVQDTRYGRAVLAESHEMAVIVAAVTRYVARRLIERERALADDAASGLGTAQKMVEHEQYRGRVRALKTFLFGIVLGAAALVALALLYKPHL